MEPHDFTLEMIRILPKAALARKYNCSVQYVRKVLQGRSGCNSPRARAIMKDATDISVILFSQVYTNNIEETGNDISNDASQANVWCVSGTHSYTCGIIGNKTTQNQQREI